jgi:hypothetical protein
VKDYSYGSADLAELAALAEAATPGPWEHIERDKPYMFKDRVNAPCGCCGLIASKVAGWDAAFIAAAREAVPQLIAELNRLIEDQR